MLMTDELSILIIAAASIAFFHTILGPDHYLPFIVMSRSGKWSIRKTTWITILYVLMILHCCCCYCLTVNACYYYYCCCYVSVVCMSCTNVCVEHSFVFILRVNELERVNVVVQLSSSSSSLCSLLLSMNTSNVYVQLLITK